MTAKTSSSKAQLGIAGLDDILIGGFARDTFTWSREVQGQVRPLLLFSS
jgi:hypothetical protein